MATIWSPTWQREVDKLNKLGKLGLECVSCRVVLCYGLWLTHLHTPRPRRAQLGLDRLHVHLLARALNHVQTDGALQLHSGRVGHLQHIEGRGGGG